MNRTIWLWGISFAEYYLSVGRVAGAGVATDVVQTIVNTYISRMVFNAD
ncbi:MAG: hypothetical protein R2795_16060 [Saprospiraceae bacterium]